MKRAILAACALALLASATLAQNAPLSGLEPRGTPQSTDLIPVLPAGAPRLESMTVGDLAGLINAGLGTGSVTTVTCGTGLSGGTFTVSGTCALADNGVALGDIAPIGANTVLGNFTGGTADVAAEPMPSCPDTGGQHLNFVDGTGFGCGTSVAPSSGIAPNLLKFGPPTYLTTAGSPGGYYDPQPAGLIDVTDGFTSTGNYTKTASATNTFTVSGGTGTISQSTAGWVLLKLTSDATLVAPQFFNAIEVTAQTAASGYSNIYAGAFSDVGSSPGYIGAYYDATGHTINVEYNYGTDENTIVLHITLTPPYVIGASLSDNSLCAWYKTSLTGPWLYAGGVSTAANRDYTVPANFASAGFQTGVLTNMDGAGSFTVSTLQGGRLGGVALLALKPVVNPDWTTYQPGASTIYFVGATLDPQAAQGLGVFTLNRATQQITETGVICTSRDSHVYCGDDAGSIVYHSNGDREVLTSSWSDGLSNSTPVHLLYEYLTNGAQPDVLTNNLTVLSSLTSLTLPFGSSGGIGAYDPAMAYDAANNRYLMAYTICIDCTFGLASYSNFFPALAYASSPTGTWTSIGIDQNLVGNWEGTSFANVNGTLYELAGGPGRVAYSSEYQCSSSRVYDETFAYQGAILGATFNSGVQTATPFSCSHPTLFQDPDGIHMDVLTWIGENASGGGDLPLGQPVIEISN